MVQSAKHLKNTEGLPYSTMEDCIIIWTYYHENESVVKGKENKGFRMAKVVPWPKSYRKSMESV